MHEWCRWVGPARLATGAAGIVAAGLAGWWLLRAPMPPVESRIPRVTTSTADLDPSPGEPPVSVSPDAVTVHVAGAVRHPGVYTVPTPARVVDAVAAAGGATTKAVLDAVNLARPLVDGEQVYIPRRGQSGGGSLSAPPTGDGGAAPTGPVNINTAGSAQLQRLPGVGPTTAKAIIDHRQRHGPFATVDGLLDVRGIGPTKLEALRGLVTV